MKRSLITFIFLLTFFIRCYAGVGYIIKVESIINPFVSRYIINEINKAETDKADLLIIELNTPGGLVDTTKKIVEKITITKIPVIVYVSPETSHAASAGTFITESADVAVMAPNTRIGAASPVTMGQKLDATMKKKITEDLTAYMKNLMERNKRNPRWAEQFVVHSKSITAKEAVDSGAIDFIADNIDDLIKKVNNFETKNKGIIKTENLKLERHTISLTLNLLNKLSHPNVASILMILGILGLITEFKTPGIGFAGVFGGISLLLALVFLQTLPINVVGVLLIILSAIFFILETQIASFGILSLGGIISLVLGLTMLIDVDPEQAKYLMPSKGLIISVAIVLGTLFSIIVWLITRAMKQKPYTGLDFIIGKTATVKQDIGEDKEGMVYVCGELWTASSLNKTPIKKGTKVKVVKVEDLILIVE